MILRRIIAHVKAQNWTAIFLDFVIVVTGVFIGIQVSNWNEARINRVDEQRFLQRLHDDVETVDALSRRVRERRIGYLKTLTEVSTIVFDGGGEGGLTDAQCLAISASHFFNVNAPELPAFSELVSSGRLDIIRDGRVRAALVEFQQTRESLNYYKSFQMLISHDLPSAYPDLIRLKSYFDDQLGESQSAAVCDLDKMRENQAFLNDFSANIDMYDGFVRDGLSPWSAQLDKAHALLDADLDIRHEETAAP